MTDEQVDLASGLRPRVVKAFLGRQRVNAVLRAERHSGTQPVTNRHALQRVRAFEHLLDGRVDTEPVDLVGHRGVHLGTTRHESERGAHHDRAAHQRSAVGDHQVGHGVAAGGFSEGRDIGGVAAEVRDVPLHPLQRGALIEQSEIARRRHMVQVTEQAEAVGHANHHHLLLGDERSRGINRQVPGAGHV